MVDEAPKAPGISRTRLLIGGAVFVGGWMAPLLIPVVASSEALDAKWKALISGLLMLGIPEIFSVVAIAILGSEGYQFLKHQIMRVFSRIRPTDHVGKTRHRIGVAMFAAPIVFGWAAPYANIWIPSLADHQVPLSIALDLVFFSSLFVLGGRFWDKLRGLFVRDFVAA